MHQWMNKRTDDSNQYCDKYLVKKCNQADYALLIENTNTVNTYEVSTELRAMQPIDSTQYLSTAIGISVSIRPIYQFYCFFFLNKL